MLCFFIQNLIIIEILIKMITIKENKKYKKIIYFIK